jgi:hypothetical protein
MEAYRVAHGKPAKPRAANPFYEPNDIVRSRPEKSGDASEGGLSDPLGIDPLDSGGFDDDLPPYMAKDDAGEAEPERPAEKPQSKKPAMVREPDDFDPPHKQVDFNTVCISIMEYAKKNAAVLDDCNITTCDVCGARCAYFYKREAALDIIALLHAGL